MRVLFGCALWFLTTLGAAAGHLSAPQGSVILTISGAISHTNAGDVADFDSAMLRELDWTEVRSFTEFTEGESLFAGPSAAAVLDAVGATGLEVVGTALDDYSVTIQISDLREAGAIFAMERDGKVLRIRDKGPIWVIFPLTQAQVKAKVFLAEAIWQLRSIDVR